MKMKKIFDENIYFITWKKNVDIYFEICINRFIFKVLLSE